MDTGAEAESKAESIEAACKAIRSADFRVLLPKLTRIASHTLAMVGWAEGARHRPGDLEAHELLNAAAVAYMTGAKTWRADLGSTPDGIVTLFATAMVNIAVHTRKRATRHVGSEPLDGALDDQPTESRRFYLRSLIGRILSVFSDDEEVPVLLQTMMGGDTKPAEMNAALGWGVDRVTVVLQRMRRRCRSLGMTVDYDGASGLEGPGPQGRDHGNPEAAGGRSRAAREPAGGPHVPRGGLER
jgi:hypothetical protein